MEKFLRRCGVSRFEKSLLVLFAAILVVNTTMVVQGTGLLAMIRRQVSGAADIRKDEITPLSEDLSVMVANPKGICEQGLCFEQGEYCIAYYMGHAAVEGRENDLLLVRYKSYYVNPGRRGECPEGTLFFIEDQKFADLRDNFEEKRKRRLEIEWSAQRIVDNR
jgi:hypothetical protein